MIEQLYLLLKRRGKRLALLNAARPGSNSTELVERYNHHLLLLNPKRVVVNLGTNDRDPALLKKNLETLALINQQRKISTIFVLEPNSPEFDMVPQDCLEAARSVAERFGLECLDMHAYYYQPEVSNSGLNWWDFVHLTSHGQKLAAGFLAANLYPKK